MVEAEFLTRYGRHVLVTRILSLIASGDLSRSISVIERNLSPNKKNDSSFGNTGLGQARPVVRGNIPGHASTGAPAWESCSRSLMADYGPGI